MSVHGVLLVKNGLLGVCDVPAHCIKSNYVCKRKTGALTAGRVRGASGGVLPWCQAKFLTCYYLSVIFLLRVKE